ncbi:DUF975 family protein [Vagococcus elongatus]|uniref:Zinc-ribbon domain-containing protein n=1 Tax=Vagococcus elongatus TaxID=180344 RepID=A0A430B206_9ENTE|nr:DUF975 family protein [Vagococcus elongatus]RSU14356.1 hypothetical protein CBF29_03385 [Vagococcus elongatus]
MKYCPNCGTELRAEAKFCSKCGYNVEQNISDNGESFNERFAIKINQMKADDDFELILEESEGLNITRAELKTQAQEKLSGRYGEWLKTIIWFTVASLVVHFVFRKAISNFFINGLLYSFRNIIYGYLGNYGYYGYGDPYSVVPRFFWFLVMILALAALFLISSLFKAVLQWSAIHTLRGQRVDGLKIFSYFIKAQKNRVLKANVLIAIYTFLWSLLFVIPGIVKGAAYAMTNYLLEKNPDLSASEAIQLSRQIMHGYKLELLILRFSFFFWNIFSIFQFAKFYVLPYQNVTEIQFLETLYNHYVQQNNKEQESL